MAQNEVWLLSRLYSERQGNRAKPRVYYKLKEEPGMVPLKAGESLGPGRQRLQ